MTDGEPLAGVILSCQCGTMADELAKAVTKIIYPALKPKGFQRHGKRDLIRFENGVVQRLYIQVSGSGSRDFCVTACGNLIAGNELVTLQPGFRITNENGADLWLPSFSADDAERSANKTLLSIGANALPFFEKMRSLQGFSELLANEKWASAHHLHFQRGVTYAALGDASAARHQLEQAILRYEDDGRSWCAGYIEKARELLNAIDSETMARTLDTWEQTNKKAHGIP